MATRKYQQTRRAERQAETRQRIVEAVMALHQEVGPARTTISAIAERAGVERLTVYRHFADDLAILQACSAHFETLVPGPNPSSWSCYTDPVERLHAALLAFYFYYRRGEDMLEKVYRDEAEMPALARHLEPWNAFIATLREELVALWGSPASHKLDAVIAHAFRFDTWQSLSRAGGLGDDETAALMLELAKTAAR